MAKVNIVTQTLGILLKIALFLTIGFWGLPLAISLNSCLCVIIFLSLYFKKINKFNYSKIIFYCLKMILICVISLIPAQLFELINLNMLPILKLFISVSLFIIVFIFMSIKLENQISKSIILKIKKVKQ